MNKMKITKNREFRRTGFDPLGPGGMRYRRFGCPPVALSLLNQLIIRVILRSYPYA
jgi:hypothetical protein